MTLSVARRVLILVVLATLAGADLVAASQSTPQPFIWWRNEQAKKELGLTVEQVAKIQSIHESTIGELRQEVDELKKCEAKLDRLRSERHCAPGVNV